MYGRNVGHFAYKTFRLLDTSPTTWTFRLHDISPAITLLDRRNLWLCSPKFKCDRRFMWYNNIAGRGSLDYTPCLKKRPTFGLL